jgi:hypothetical protein
MLLLIVDTEQCTLDISDHPNRRVLFTTPLEILLSWALNSKPQSLCPLSCLVNDKVPQIYQ